jgi:hypothetical protein
MTQGVDTLRAVRQIRELLVEISLLLKTADDQMKERDWHEKIGNICVSGASQSLQNPRWWMPHKLHRYYKHDRWSHRLVAISVILDAEPEYKDLVVEPLASGIVFDYGDGQLMGTMTAEQYDYAGWHIYMPGYMPERKRDGTVLVCGNPEKEWPKDKCKARRVASFALPLVDISDSDLLLTKLVERLVGLAEKPEL